MPKFLKFLIGPGVLAALALVVWWCYATQWFATRNAERMARMNPILIMTPQPLPDAAADDGAPMAGVNIAGFGIQFPWTIESAPSIRPDRTIVYKFPGRTVALQEEPPGTQLARWRAKLAHGQTLDTLFAGDAPQTDYELVARILSITPSSFSWRMTKAEAARDAALYQLKATSVPQEAKWGIFSVETPTFRGFQYGAPEAQQTGVEVDLYNAESNLRLMFRENGGAPAVIPQSDINRIVQSVRLDATHVPSPSVTGLAQSQ